MLTFNIDLSISTQSPLESLCHRLNLQNKQTIPSCHCYKVVYNGDGLTNIGTWFTYINVTRYATFHLILTLSHFL